MFDAPFGRWVSPDGHPTLFRVDRPVWVNFQAVFPGLGQSMTGVPMWLRAGGVRCEPWMEGRQVAWLRRFRWRMVCMGTRASQQRQPTGRAHDAAMAGAHTISPRPAAGMGRTPPAATTVSARSTALRHPIAIHHE